MAITQVSNSLVKQDLTISGGTVDNTVIGSGTPAAGTFTTVAGTLASTVTGTTQAASDNSTKIATTAYVTTALANLVDSAPGTLNTLNELAAALGDDANFSTTVTSSIAAKLPLAGGTLTGATTINGGNPPLVLSNSGDAKINFVRSSNTINYAMSSAASGGHGFYDNAASAYDLYMKAGNIGIGTTAPAFTTTDFKGIEVQVSGDLFPVIRLERVSGSSKTNQAYQIAVGTSGNYHVRNDTQGTAPFSIATDDSVTFSSTGTFSGGAANNNDDANILTLNASQHARLLVDTSSTSGHRATLALESNGNELTLGTTGSASYLTSVGSLEITGGTVLVGGVTNTAGGYQFKVGTSNNEGELALYANAAGADVLSYDRTNGHYNNLFFHAGSVAFTRPNQYVSIGTQVPDLRVNQMLQVTGTGTRGGISVSSYINAATSAIFDFNKSRNVSPGSHTIVQDDDALGVLIWRGDDGTQFVDSAAISGVVDATPGVNDMPGRLEFFTSPDGTTGLLKRFQIDNGGNISFMRGSSGAQGMYWENQGRLVINNTNSLHELVFAGSDPGDILYQGTNYLSIASSNNVPIRFYVGGSQRAEFNDNGLKFTAGHGIEFSLSTPSPNTGATAGSQILDDYEEGTWTPTLPNGGSVNSIAAARYTKIGGLVQAQCYITCGSIPNNGSHFQIGGLPYTPNQSNAFGGGTINYGAYANYDVYQNPIVHASHNYIYFHRSDGTPSPVTNSIIYANAGSQGSGNLVLILNVTFRHY